MSERAETAGDLRPEYIEAVFREFLGRVASPGDVAIWMQIGSLRGFLDGVLASEEYAQRLARRELSEQARARASYLNCWIEGWERSTRPVGELSPDGVAIVGERGHLFIYGGTNDNVVSHRGEIEMAPEWMISWQRLLSERLEHSQRAGRRLVCLVVPEKLAVYSDVFPQDLTARAPRPVLCLLEAGLPLVYPQHGLQDARKDGDTYMRTDSHMTTHGNLILAKTTLKELGIAPERLEEARYSRSRSVAAGDLGGHFDPPVIEVMTTMAGASRATLVADNWAQIAAVNGHIGTTRVFRYEDAPDQRTVVIFGDSYSFGDEGYQGLSWFLAQMFREVHFVWVPFGWDPDYLDSVAADLVICQTAERFIGRVPESRVDVRSLALETVSRRRPLTEERIFQDRPVPD